MFREQPNDYTINRLLSNLQNKTELVNTLQELSQLRYDPNNSEYEMLLKEVKNLSEHRELECCYIAGYLWRKWMKEKNPQETPQPPNIKQRKLKVQIKKPRKHVISPLAKPPLKSRRKGRGLKRMEQSNIQPTESTLRRDVGILSVKRMKEEDFEIIL